MIPQPPNWLCRPTAVFLTHHLQHIPALQGWVVACPRPILVSTKMPRPLCRPGSMQPSLSHLPSLCFCLQLFVCLIFPFFGGFHPSFLCWLATVSPSSCVSTGISTHSFLPISTIPFPQSSVILLLPSFFPAAIRAHQIPEQLCKAISGSSLIPGGGEQSWTIRLFHAAPILLNTTTSVGLWAHLCRWPCEHPWPRWGSHSGIQHRGAHLATLLCPCACPLSASPPWRSLGGVFGGGRASVAGLMCRACCREFPRSLRSPAHPSCCWIYELCVCFVIKQLIALEFLISFGGW